MGGRYHWRSYSLSSVPLRGKGTITITVRAMPEGFLSDHLVRGLAPGTIVRLAAPAGEFTLPNPPPAKTLFLVAGQRHHPGDVDAAHARPARHDAGRDGGLLLAHRGPDDLPRRAAAAARQAPVAARRRALHRPAGHVRAVRARDRPARTGASAAPGPVVRRRCSTRARSSGRRPASRSSSTSSGSPSSSATATPRAASSPSPTPASRSRWTARPRCSRPARRPASGCPTAAASASATPARITLASGRIKDLRNGEEHLEPNESVQTCVTAACGDVTLNI